MILLLYLYSSRISFFTGRVIQPIWMSDFLECEPTCFNKLTFAPVSFEDIVKWPTFPWGCMLCTPNSIFYIFSINLAVSSTPVSRLACHLQHVPLIKLHIFQTLFKWKQANKLCSSRCVLYSWSVQGKPHKKKHMLSPSYELFRKQKHNCLFIKTEENILWNLRIWMCCFAVK